MKYEVYMTQVIDGKVVKTLAGTHQTRELAEKRVGRLVAVSKGKKEAKDFEIVERA